MRKLLMITCYNCCEYIGDAINSAILQSVPFDHIYVIDDGSSDGSLEIIKNYANENKNITFIHKQNAGQLSCFNIFSKYLFRDDLIWLMDSDDIYPADYLELMLAAWSPDRVAVAFSNPINFTDKSSRPVSSRISTAPTVRIGASVHLTHLTQCWIGAPTSCMALTGEEYLRIFPYPDEEEWKIRADDVLIYASSLLGSTKIYIASLGIGYRVHSNNNYAGKNFGTETLKRRDIAISRIFSYYGRNFNVNSVFCKIKYFVRACVEVHLVPADLRKRFFVPSPLHIFVRTFIPYAARRFVQIIRYSMFR